MDSPHQAPPQTIPGLKADKLCASFGQKQEKSTRPNGLTKYRGQCRLSDRKNITLEVAVVLLRMEGVWFVMFLAPNGPALSLYGSWHRGRKNWTYGACECSQHPRLIMVEFDLDETASAQVCRGRCRSRMNRYIGHSWCQICATHPACSGREYLQSRPFH